MTFSYVMGRASLLIVKNYAARVFCGLAGERRAIVLHNRQLTVRGARGSASGNFAPAT